jgi:UDP-glucose 4-epimerase
MKIFLTGGSGYVGINLRKHLSEHDCTTFNYDITAGHDVLDESRLYRYMKGCDAVVHLAGQPDVSYCERNVEEAVDLNFVGTCNVARTAGLLELPIVFISTLAAKTAHNVYGMTKRLAEIIVLKNHGIVLRLANVYGGLGYLTRKRSAMASFIRHKQQGLPAEIFGDGSARRDFVHIDDVCRAIIQSLGAPPGVYEICTGTQTSIVELADLIGVEYEFKSPRAGDIKEIPSEPSHEALSWKSQIELEDGVRELL